MEFRVSETFNATQYLPAVARLGAEEVKDSSPEEDRAFSSSVNASATCQKTTRIVEEDDINVEDDSTMGTSLIHIGRCRHRVLRRRP